MGNTLSFEYEAYAETTFPRPIRLRTLAQSLTGFIRTNGQGEKNDFFSAAVRRNFFSEKSACQQMALKQA